MPLKITFDKTEIEEYLRIESGTDTKLVATFKMAAMDEAETFLNTDFATTVLNEYGTTTITPNEAPASVKEWVLNRIAEKYENRGNPVKPSYGPLKPHRVIQFRGFE